MIPDNHLFATLDVTAHTGRLPNNVNVVYMDTVGFISNLHYNLFDAFTATLEDTLSAVRICFLPFSADTSNCLDKKLVNYPIY